MLLLLCQPFQSGSALVLSISFLKIATWTCGVNTFSYPCTHMTNGHILSIFDILLLEEGRSAAF